MNDSNVVIAAFSEEQTARLTGLTVSKLKRWDSTGFFRPSLAAENRRSPYSRIYSFVDIASLRVISILQNKHNVSLQYLRKVSKKLPGMDNAAWHKTKLWVGGRQVHFTDPATKKKHEATTGQFVIEEVIELKDVFEDTQKQVLEFRQQRRPSEEIGRTEQHRYIAHNAEVFSGTRIPVAAVISFLEDGHSPDEIIREYPGLTVEDIILAEKRLKDDQAA